MFPSHDTIREASDRVHTDSAARQQVEIYSWRKKKSLQPQEEQGVIQQMVWPPQSPHLNIVVSVWDYMKRQKTHRELKSTKELWQVLWDVVNNLPGKKEYKLGRLCAAWKTKEKNISLSWWLLDSNKYRNPETCSSVFLKKQQLKSCFLPWVIDRLVISNLTLGLVSLKCSWSYHHWLKALKF